MLEPGDHFEMTGSLYKVMRIQAGKLYYKNVWRVNNQIRGPEAAMGANSRERIILVTNKTKQNEHSNRPDHFRKS